MRHFVIGLFVCRACVSVCLSVNHTTYITFVHSILECCGRFIFY